MEGDNKYQVKNQKVSAAFDLSNQEEAVKRIRKLITEIYKKEERIEKPLFK